MFNGKLSQKNIITGILVILILYFSFYFLFGRYGFIQYTKLKRETAVKEQSLEKIQAKNEQTSIKINSLKSNNIDPDLLDEQVRKNLGYVAEDEKVIYYE